MSKKENFRFTADHIGSEILERFSKDIYTPKAIVRELVKNGYDSYFQLEKHLAGAGGNLTTDPVVRVNVAGSNIIVDDDGLGLDRNAIELLISIALTDKRDIPGVTGFRGIGFWSGYTGGDTIVVETTRIGVNRQFRLTLNTKRMRQLQGPTTSIGRIMNDPQCVRLESDAAKEEDHYTRVLIHAQSKDASLKPLTENTDLMRKILLEGCSCSVEPGTNLGDKVREFYDIHNIHPGRLFFQNDELVKSIPAGVTDFTPHTLEVPVGDQKVVLAHAWFATNRENKRLETPFAGVRVYRDSFPIGRPNLHSDRQYPDSVIILKQGDLLDWHIGEVHLAHDDLRPNASGEDLRDSTLFIPFREKLRELYTDLVETANVKSKRARLRKDYTNMYDSVRSVAAKNARGEKISEEERATVQKFAERVQRDNVQGRGRLADDTPPTSNASLVRDSEVKEKRKQITRLLEDIGLHAKPATQPSAKEKKKPSLDGQPTPAAGSNDAADLVQKTTVLGLLDELRDAVMEVLAGESALQKELLGRINEVAERL
jgi:hypothetical protein